MSNPFDDLANLLRNEMAALRDEIALLRQCSEPQPPALEDDFLTTQEAANLLKVTPQTIVDWANRGLINRIKLANRARYSKNELLAAMKSKNVKK